MRRALACLSAVLLLGGCSNGHKQAAESPSPTPPPVLATAKPVVHVPSGPPPKTLVRTDLVLGTGDFAIPGKVVTVQYVGVHYANGKEFDTSWGGHPLSFRLGGEEVIAGWDEGVVGMRVGGRRMLVIPPDEGYGDTGDESGEIKPGETLVFVVDLVSVGGVGGAVPGSPPA